MFRRVLIANRGEIACRVAATLRRMGITGIAVFTDPDAGARHVRVADQAVAIGPARAYLDMDSIIAAARMTGAEAVHPGYGFLAENADFAEACAAAGLVFIGPAPATLRAMGSKLEAKRLMADAGVPVVPGYHGSDQADSRLAEEAAAIGYPLMVKAAAGGGGKGMRIVRSAEQFIEALQGARRESENAFGDSTMILERYLERPRHVEFQIFGDRHGRQVHLGERECSTQRRYQKVIEEAPSPFLDPATREAMGRAAVDAARAVDYVGAGTVEFMVDADRGYYFMEMNTRLQVEHPVTEMVRGVDLVRWQLEIAAGGRLPAADSLPPVRGHAIEARVYAEDPYHDFLPSTGTIECFAHPKTGRTLRVDAGVSAGDSVSIHYDPLIAKIVACGPDRDAALDSLGAALADTGVIGPRTNLPLLQALCRHPDVRGAAVDTTFLDTRLDEVLGGLPPPDPGHLGAAAAAILADARLPAAAGDPWSPWHATDGWESAIPAEVTLRLAMPSGVARVVSIGDGVVVVDAETARCDIVPAGRNRWRVCLDGTVQIFETRAAGGSAFVSNGRTGYVLARLPRYADDRSHSEADHHPGAPMPGSVVKVHVAEGDRVAAGDPLVVLEGMKMEYTLRAPFAGVITALRCAEGDMVEADAPLVDLDETTESL
jgi:3-methylcrotonyl-CoA carboxylase alpha subunit